MRVCCEENCGDALPQCGTTSAYRKYACRCDPCCAAKKESARKYYEGNTGQIAESRRAYYAENREARVEYSRRYRAENLDAVKEQARRYRESNPDKVAEIRRKYRTNNADKVAEYQRSWYEANRDAVSEYAQSYRIKNPEKFRAAAHRRRARLVGAFVEEVSRQNVFDGDEWICQRCGIECPKDAVFPNKDFATLDHIIPLSKGGEHSYANTQTLCFSCNCAKRDRIQELTG